MMKKLTSLAILSLLVITPLCAQQTYKHSVGVIAGSFNGLSYKCFPTGNPHFALQCDLGISLLTSPVTSDTYVLGEKQSSLSSEGGINQWSLKANPNLLYQTVIDEWNWGGMSWYAGGGISLGSAFGGIGGGKIPNNFQYGFNGIAGVELGLDDAPLAISFDFRPGYGGEVYKSEKLENTGYILSFFDWAITLGIRYTL